MVVPVAAAATVLLTIMAEPGPAMAMEILVVFPDASAAVGQVVLEASCPAVSAMAPAIAWFGRVWCAVPRAVSASCHMSEAARAVLKAFCKGRP
jgi:hypothetical protein